MDDIEVLKQVDWMPEARQFAAQCWCDEETSGIEMDVRLAESMARRIAAWMDTSAFHARNESYWRERAEVAERRLPENATEPMQRAMQRAVLLRKSMNDVWRSALLEAGLLEPVAAIDAAMGDAPLLARTSPQPAASAPESDPV
jgi:hypothetical protein